MEPLDWQDILATEPDGALGAITDLSFDPVVILRAPGGPVSKDPFGGGGRGFFAPQKPTGAWSGLLDALGAFFKRNGPALAKIIPGLLPGQASAQAAAQPGGQIILIPQQSTAPTPPPSAGRSGLNTAAMIALGGVALVVLTRK